MGGEDADRELVGEDGDDLVSEGEVREGDEDGDGEGGDSSRREDGAVVVAAASADGFADQRFGGVGEAVQAVRGDPCGS